MIETKIYFEKDLTFAYSGCNISEWVELITPNVKDWTDCGITIEGDVIRNTEIGEAVRQVLLLMSENQSLRSRKSLFNSAALRHEVWMDNPMFGLTFSQDISSSPILQFIDPSLETVCAKALQLREVAAEDNPANVRLERLALVFSKPKYIEEAKLLKYALNQWSE